MMYLELTSESSINDVIRQGTNSNVHSVFVNYTEPGQWRGKSRHKAAQSFVSSHYRRKNQKIPLEERDSRQWTKAEQDADRTEATALLSRLSTQSSFMTALGAGRVDPFNAYCVPNLPVHVHQMLDHGKTHSSPSTSPCFK